MFSSAKHVTTIKPHRCCGCSRKFSAGTRMEKYAGLYGGDFFHGYMCVTCESILGRLKDCGDDIYWAGAFEGAAVALENANGGVPVTEAAIMRLGDFAENVFSEHGLP